MKHSLAIIISTALVFAGMAWLIITGELAFTRDDAPSDQLVIDNVVIHCPRSIETDIRELPTDEQAHKAISEQCNGKPQCDIDTALLLDNDKRSATCSAEIIIYYHCQTPLEDDDYALTPFPPAFIYEGQSAPLRCK